MSKPRIAVAMVSTTMVPASFAYDLASMAAYTAPKLPESIDFGFSLIDGKPVAQARQQMLQELLVEDVTHILWVDTDMRFPRDALARLLQHNVPMVGINYCTRGIPPEFVAIKKIGLAAEGGGKLVTGPDSTGLEEVEAIGFGLVLMRVDAIPANMRSLDDGPWFDFEWMPHMAGGKWLSEDVYFCKLLRAGGTRIFVDHDLSKECRHVGQFEFELSHAMAAREQN